MCFLRTPPLPAPPLSRRHALLARSHAQERASLAWSDRSMCPAAGAGNLTVPEMRHRPRDAMHVHAPRPFVTRLASYVACVRIIRTAGLPSVSSSLTPNWLSQTGLLRRKYDIDFRDAALVRWRLAGGLLRSVSSHRPRLPCCVSTAGRDHTLLTQAHVMTPSGLP